MVFGFLLVWCFLGNGLLCFGILIMLEGTFESYSFVFNVVPLERNKCSLL